MHYWDLISLKCAIERNNLQPMLPLKLLRHCDNWDEIFTQAHVYDGVFSMEHFHVIGLFNLHLRVDRPQRNKDIRYKRWL